MIHSFDDAKYCTDALHKLLSDGKRERENSAIIEQLHTSVSLENFLFMAIKISLRCLKIRKSFNYFPSSVRVDASRQVV